MALLGKLTYIQSYDADNSAYPILGILCDPRAPGYQVPPTLEPHPDSQTWPNHVFHSATPIPSSSDGRVMWSYSIFPGPQVPSTRYDPLFGPIQGLRRRVVNTGQTASLTSTVKTTYDSQNDSTIIYELEETNSNGTGSLGNPTYPIQINDFYDNERGAVDQRVQLVADTTSSGGLTVVGTTVTDIRYEAVTQFHRKKTTETWTVPAPLRTADDYDIQRGAIQTTLQIIVASSVEATLTASSNVVTETTYKPLNKELLEQKIQTFAYPGPEITSEPEIDRDGSVFTIKRQIDVASNITEGETIEAIGGGLKIITSEPYSGQSTGPLRYKITKTRSLPGTAFTRTEVDGETGSPVSIEMQIIATPSFPLAQTAGSEISYQPISSVHGTKITTSMTGFASVTVVDYPTSSMSAPPLIISAAITSTASRDGTPAISIVWNKRSAKTREVKMTRTKVYGTQANMLTAQGLLTIENPGVIDVIRDPWFVPAIRETNVLTNAVTLDPYTTGTENPKWPFAAETVSWAATTPPATGVGGYIGRFVVISANVEYWKYNLWRLTKIEATTF